MWSVMVLSLVGAPTDRLTYCRRFAGLYRLPPGSKRGINRSDERPIVRRQDVTLRYGADTTAVEARNNFGCQSSHRSSSLSSIKPAKTGKITPRTFWGKR